MIEFELNKNLIYEDFSKFESICISISHNKNLAYLSEFGWEAP